MADKYLEWNPYNYTLNNPVRLVDPDEMEAEDWYENSEGNVVYDENVKSQADLDNLGIKAYYLGKSGFGINESTGMGVQYNSDGTTQEVDNMLGAVTIIGRANNTKEKVSSAADGVGGLGGGLQSKGGSLRITDGAYNGNGLSLKHYESGWTGGSRARIKTYQLGKAGKLVGRVGTAATLAVGAYDIGSNAYYEGGFGTYTQQATGRFAGTLGGAWIGAKGGAIAGAWFGGWGAIPGAIIGGIIGGSGGSYLGEKGVQKIQQIKKP